MSDIKVPATYEVPNWSKFYEALVYFGPLALHGIPAEWVRWFQEEGAASDWFWSESICESLCVGWTESPVQAVEQAMYRYVESVQAGLAELPANDCDDGWLRDADSGKPLPWSECIARISCRKIPKQILEALVNAADRPEDEEG